MDDSFLIMLVSTCSVLIVFTLLSIFLLVSSSGSSKKVKQLGKEEVSRHQKRKIIAAQNAAEAYLLIQEEHMDLKITYKHKLSKRQNIHSEVSHMERRYTGRGKQKITA